VPGRQPRRRDNGRYQTGQPTFGARLPPARERRLPSLERRSPTPRSTCSTSGPNRERMSCVCSVSARTRSQRASTWGSNPCVCASADRESRSTPTRRGLTGARRALSTAESVRGASGRHAAGQRVPTELPRAGGHVRRHARTRWCVREPYPARWRRLEEDGHYGRCQCRWRPRPSTRAVLPACHGAGRCPLLQPGRGAVGARQLRRGFCSASDGVRRVDGTTWLMGEACGEACPECQTARSAESAAIPRPGHRPGNGIANEIEPYRGGIPTVHGRRTPGIAPLRG
jgi:hypothetical protein